MTPPLKPADSYGVVLGLLILTFVLSMSSGDGWMRSVTSILTLVTVVTALLTSRVQRRVLVLVIVLGICAFGFQIAAHIVDAPEDVTVLRGVGTLINAAMLAMLPVVVLIRVSSHKTVTGETILGLLSVYVGLGSVFAMFYQGIDGVTATNFFNQVKDPASGDYLYFSFVTLTTLGFGDLTPAQGFGRSLTVLEALIGQVFLVTVVARGVSLLGTTRDIEGRHRSS